NLSTTLQTFYTFSICITVFAVLLYSQVTWIQLENNSTFLFSGFSTSIICLCCFLTGISASAFNFEKTLNSFNQFVYQSQQHNFSKILKGQTIIPLLCGIFLIIAYFSTFLFYYEISLFAIYTSCSYSIIHSAIFVVNIQFMTFVVILNQCFNQINNKLLHLIKYSMYVQTEYTCKQNTTQMKHVPEMYVQKESTCKQNTTRVIKTLSKLHNSLSKLTNHVNTIYSAHILLHLLLIYSQLSFCLYHIFKTVLFSE
ncbi:hypothetical protein L9F63_001612, partial [Diploptera punctata]